VAQGERIFVEGSVLDENEILSMDSALNESTILWWMKNQLTEDRTRHKQFEALHRWYMSEHTREKIPFKLGVLVWCWPNTLELENQLVE